MAVALSGDGVNGETEGEFEVVVGFVVKTAMRADLITAVGTGLFNKGFLQATADALLLMVRVDAKREDFGFGERTAVEGDRGFIYFWADGLNHVAQEAQRLPILIVGDHNVGAEVPCGCEIDPMTLIHVVNKLIEGGRGGVVGRD